MARLGITTSELELPSMLHLPFNHTVTLILITCIISFIAFSKEQVMNRLIFWPPAIQRGQYDRFISHGFIHAYGSHLLFNIITLFFSRKIPAQISPRQDFSAESGAMFHRPVCREPGLRPHDMIPLSKTLPMRRTSTVPIARGFPQPQ